IEDVGRNDNFLALGGHSLLALQAVEALRSRFGLALSLRQLFSTKSLGELAAELVEPDDGSLTAADASLVARPRDGALPLSLAQRRLWTAEMLAGGAAGGAYVMTGYLDLAGPLSVDALKQAFAGLMDRHEILRTAYAQTADGLPLAKVNEAVALALPVIDLTDLDAAGQAAHLEQLEIEEANDAFSLDQAPLLRVKLLRQGENRHRLLISMHHVIGDAWSFGVLLDVLVFVYRASLERLVRDVSPLPLLYIVYELWLYLWAAGAAAAAEQDFWRSYLHKVGRRVDLPCDFPRPAVFDLAGDSVRFGLPGEVVARLEVLGRGHGASLFMVLLAAFEVLMHRFSGADDMVIGTDMAGRPHRALESLVGFFVNVLPLRARPGAADTFSDLLVQVREDVLLAFEHPLLPFDRIVDVVGVPRDRTRNPLVQVLFVMQSAPKGHFDVEGLSAELHQAKARRSKFDMALFLDPLGSRSDDGIAGEWVFATSLFERTTVERLAAAWCRLLTELVDAPDSRLRDFDLPILEGSAMPPSQQPEAVPSRAGRRLEAKLDRLSRLTTGAVAPRPREAVRVEPMMPNGSLPLLVEPSAPGLDPVGWASAERDWIETRLRRHGALLFRGFGLATPQDFEAFAEAIHPGLYGSYGDLPKKEGGRNTYRSTPYPQDQMILFHNESAHLHRWPRKQWFFCEQPSEKGGATPLVDCRELYRRLPGSLAERFERLGLLYQRNFTERLDVSWRDFFKTDSREAVEAACRAVGTELTWFGDELQTRTHCPAVIVHPLTGERSFFNQVQLHHTRSLAPGLREDLIAMVGEDRLPRQVFFGDGTPIDDEIMDRLGELYEACAVRFSWRKGDVAMLDNMLAAHARDPFEGARRIVVAMGDMVNREDVQGQALEEGGE
ncbi:MAG: condensation domain-containing protein, partial [Kiloniellaceae bacterium]